MLINEALKLIGKKPTSIAAEIADRAKRLGVICSKLSDDTSYEYKTAEGQSTAVKELIQGTIDKITHLGALKHAVTFLNATTSLTLRLGDKDVTKTVDQWIARKDIGIPMTQAVLSALKPRHLEKDRIQVDAAGAKTLVQVVRFYDEAQKDKALELLLEEERAIETALDKYNCTTEILSNLLN